MLAPGRRGKQGMWPACLFALSAAAQMRSKAGMGRAPRPALGHAQQVRDEPCAEVRDGPCAEVWDGPCTEVRDGPCAAGVGWAMHRGPGWAMRSRSGMGHAPTLGLAGWSVAGNCVPLARSGPLA
eukprot:360648-Chlamydomonas_euryale.AAC.4